MSKSLLWLLQAALLTVLFQPIACSSDDIFPARRVRSSSIDTSQYISDNISNLMENKPIENRARRPEQHPHQHQYQSEVRMPNVKRIPNINDTIRSIFHVGPEAGLRLFNPTFNTSIKPITDQMQADDSFIGISPNEQQLFKVQRTPDGKLNLDFNDSLFLQRPTQAQFMKETTNKDFIYPGQIYVPPKDTGGSVPDKNSNPSFTCQHGQGQSKSFCTKVRNYPSQSELESYLKHEFSNLEVFFSEDLVQPKNISQRMNNDELDEEYLCRSQEKIIYPEAAVNKHDNWLMIVNNQEKFRQGVRIEECLDVGETCHYATFPNHYVATCQQNYIYRQLVAITPNGTVFKDHFKMPSCCQCVVRVVRN